VSDLVPLFGLDPLIRPQLAMSDLSRRLAASGGGWYEVASASTVTLPADGLHPLSRHPELDQAAADLEGGALFAARWG
jgi:hypothetical protein